MKSQYSYNLYFTILENIRNGLVLTINYMMWMTSSVLILTIMFVIIHCHAKVNCDTFEMKCYYFSVLHDIVVYHASFKCQRKFNGRPNFRPAWYWDSHGTRKHLKPGIHSGLQFMVELKNKQRLSLYGKNVRDNFLKEQNKRYLLILHSQWALTINPTNISGYLFVTSEFVEM